MDVEGISRRIGMFQLGNTATAAGSISKLTTASVHTTWRDAADARRMRTAAAAATMITELLMAISTIAGLIAYLPAHASVSTRHSGADTRRRTAALLSCR